MSMESSMLAICLSFAPSWMRALVERASIGRWACATLLISAALAASAPVTSASAAEPTASKPRPRIGLVLSGGGARGYAHLGVLRVLEENYIPIDAIAGTSMGAVIGGLYASGR